MSEYIGAVEAARLLGISRQACTAACRAGRLKAIRIGRDWLLDRIELAAFLQEKEARRARHEAIALDATPGKGDG